MEQTGFYPIFPNEPLQGGSRHETLDQMATRLLQASLPSTSRILDESTAASTRPAKTLSRASKRQSDAIATAPKRQKLQVQREEVTRTEQTKVEKIRSSKGLLGFLYVCKTCKKTFKWRLRCIAHAKKCGVENSGKKKRKLSQRRLQCNVCQFSSTTRAELKKHRQSEHGALLRSHRCSRCSKPFASTKSFVRHIRRHASDASFACPIIGCDKKFSTLANALRHQKLHLEPEACKSSSPPSVIVTTTSSSVPSSLQLVPSLLESSLPINLRNRNQRIRDLWNNGILQLSQQYGDSPAELNRRMKIVSSRLYTPAPLASSLSSSTSSTTSSDAASSDFPPTNSIAASSFSPSTGSSPSARSSSPTDPSPRHTSSDTGSETVERSVELCSKSTQTDNYSCDICMKSFADNAHVRRHKSDMHEPREGVKQRFDQDMKTLKLLSWVGLFLYSRTFL